MEAPGWGGGCYQLGFQQDAFDGGEEGLVHSEALEPRGCPLCGGPVPAIPNTEHLRGAHQTQPPLPPAREGNWEDGNLERWGSKQEQGGTLRNLQEKQAGRLGAAGEACPDGPPLSCPECPAGACTGPPGSTWGGEGQGGEEWSALALLKPNPARRRGTGRRGERRWSTQKLGGAGR